MASKTPPQPEMTPAALIQWCQGHHRHVKTASWLASVYGTVVISKPDLDTMRALLMDLKSHAPAEFLELAVTMLEAVPPSFLTRVESDGYRGIVQWLELELDVEQEPS